MSESAMNTPILWINTYLKERLEQELNLSLDIDMTIPFFPSSPTNLEDLYTMFPEGGTMCTYDRMFRMRRSPFPHIKAEQGLYYFYATAENKTSIMMNIQEAMFRIMDREDESAEDLNNWIKKHGKIGGFDCKFYFHRFKIYQLEEVRDLIDFGTARTYAGNKIIIDFEYHQTSNVYNEDGSILRPGILD